VVGPEGFEPSTCGLKVVRPVYASVMLGPQEPRTVLSERPERAVACKSVLISAVAKAVAECRAAAVGEGSCWHRSERWESPYAFKAE